MLKKLGEVVSANSSCSSFAPKRTDFLPPSLPSFPPSLLSTQTTISHEAKEPICSRLSLPWWPRSCLDFTGRRVTLHHLCVASVSPAGPAPLTGAGLTTFPRDTLLFLRWFMWKHPKHTLENSPTDQLMQQQERWSTPTFVSKEKTALQLEITEHKKVIFF